MILALSQAPDLAANVARAEAKVRRSVVSIPVAPGLPEVRRGDDWPRFATLVDGALEATPYGFARRDRPLLITPRDADSHGLNGWPLLGPVRHMIESLSDQDFGAARGTRLSGRMDALSEGDRQLVRSRISPPQISVGGQAVGSQDDHLKVTISPQIALYDENGKAMGIYVNSPAAPFDPSAYLAKLTFQEPDPVPDALAKAVEGRSVATPLTSLTLPAWAALLKGNTDLRVDERAKAWGVAVGSPGPKLLVVDALRAVARAHRLYWRPVGEGWVLAASPSDPRPFANAWVKATAMANFVPVLDRMARAGFLSEDMLALLVDGQDKTVNALPSEDIARLRRLFASGEPWIGDRVGLDRMLASSNLGKATLNVVFSMSVDLERMGSSSGYGVMLP